QANDKRWEGYLSRILRKDMPKEYDRIAVKSVVTLLSNWRTNRGGLLHEGIIPSHAVGYFVGFWAWDSWRFSVALARFAPELAKNNIRAMFDYQLPDGMIIDCIYTNPEENNARDSKPPLAAWAVDEIFTHTQDTAFVREMYPQLLAYHRWWYLKRDHNRNGICEFGSTDGTTEAAAWESGMDNAIRFDNAQMVKNDAENAWSFDQESVDLNAYLAQEYQLLKKFASLIGQPFEEKDYTADVANYFFDTETGFFFDRRLSDGSFVKEEGCEAYIPLWTGIATPEQMERAMKLLTDTTKFATYIPFPTVAADNPKFMPKGYWRGPIWLDQTYFAIKGLRNYGYNDRADACTKQVFDRLQGLKNDAPIHENYGTHTGECLKAPHFSWSSVHLLLLYEEYGKQANDITK
ncbi:MAG: trehalase family glycosidase, partial [Bacteroides sp.]